MTPFSLKELSKKCRAAFNQAMDSTQLTSNVAQQTKLSQAGGSRGFASALNFAHTKRK